MAEAPHDAPGASDVAPGMPQLAFETFPSQIFWLLAALAVLYFALSRVALPKIASVIEERHDAIEDDLDRAAEFKRRAEEAEAAYDKALAEARGEAEEIARKTREAISAEIEKATAKADAEIAARTAESEARIGEIRDGAMASVAQVAAETAEALVEALAPGVAPEGAAKAEVDRRLAG